MCHLVVPRIDEGLQWDGSGVLVQSLAPVQFTPVNVSRKKGGKPPVVSSLYACSACPSKKVAIGKKACCLPVKDPGEDLDNNAPICMR